MNIMLLIAIYITLHYTLHLHYITFTTSTNCLIVCEHEHHVAIYITLHLQLLLTVLR